MKKEPGEKVSILDDIDFELELIGNNNINVDYIINLLKDLVPESPSYTKDRGRILKLVNETERLRSKIDLIEKFIDENIGRAIETQTPIEEEFDTFMKKERKQAFCDLIEDENLKEDKTRKIIEEYEFSNKFDEDEVEETFKDEKLGLIKRMKKRKSVIEKIKEILEKFEY